MASSVALSRLQAELADLDDLDALTRLKTGGKRGPTQGIEVARRGAIMLLNSHFEAYLEGVLEEALKSINTGFDSTTLARDFTTPRPDRIDRLFLLLGIDRISQQISWNNAGNKAVRNAINELQSARNAIAHGEQNAKATKSDVNRFRRYVEGFCSGVDKIVAERVTNMTGVRPW